VSSIDVAVGVAVAASGVTSEVELVRDGESVDLAGVEPCQRCHVVVALLARVATERSFEERIHRSIAAAFRAFISGVVRHLISDLAVLAVFITAILGPESCGVKSLLGDRVFDEVS
jgi:hypothetical protein